MNTASAKAKGRLGQQEVCAAIQRHSSQPLEFRLELEEEDVQSRPMGSQGEDLIMSPLARRTLYFDDWEVKRRSRVSILRWVEQAFKRKSKKPIVCFREDRGEWYCLTRLDDMLELIARKDKSVV